MVEEDGIISWGGAINASPMFGSFAFITYVVVCTTIWSFINKQINSQIKKFYK